MKKVFLSLLVLIVILGGGYVYYTKQMMSESASQITDATTSAAVKLPECSMTLQPIQPINIDDVIKDCTSKKKTGTTPGGIGNMQEYIITNGQLLSNIYDPSESTGKAICYLSNTQGQTLYKPTDKSGLSTGSDRMNISQSGYEAIMHIVDKGILAGINVSSNVDSFSCLYSNTTGLDSDCVGMKQTSAWTDGINYFVAGWRDDMPNTLLYVINDKVYLPGSSTIGMHDEKELGKGSRQFVDIKTGKATVKRMIDEKIHPEKKLPNGMDSTTYTLQTCEIEL